MSYFLVTVMSLIAIRFFMLNRYFFTVSIKDAISMYKEKRRAEINADALLGGVFLILSILTAYLDKQVV